MESFGCEPLAGYNVPIPEAVVQLPDPDILRACPSELAIQRMERLKDVVDIFPRDIEKQPILSVFLREQKFGFWDDVIVAMHANELEYHSFIRDAVFDDPRLYFTKPEVFEGIIKPEEMREAAKNSAYSYDNLHHYFEPICNLSTSEKASEYAEKIIDSGYIKFFDLKLTANVLAVSDAPLEEKQIIFKKILMEKNSNIWSSIADVKLTDETSGSLTHRKNKNLMSYLQQLLDAGITSYDDIKHIGEQKLRHVDEKEFGSAYQKEEIAAAIAAVGLRVANKDETRVQTVLEEYVKAVVSYDLKSFEQELAKATVSGFCTQKQVESACGTLSKRTINEYRQYVDYYEKLIADNEAFGKDSFVHSDSESILSLHQKIVVNGENFQTGPGVYTILFEYGGPLVLEQKQLIEKYFEIEEPFNITYSIDKLIKIYKDDAPKLKEIFERNVLSGKEDIDFENWKDWADCFGYDEDQVRNLFFEHLHKGRRNPILTCRRAVDAPSGFLNKEEVGSLLRNIFDNYELENYEVALLTDICEGYLGRQLSYEYFGDISDEENPVISGMFVRSGLDIAERDYYDLSAMIKDPTVRNMLNNTGKMKPFIDTCLSKLAIEHMADIALYLGEEMTDLQKEVYLGRLHRNTALTELETSNPYFKRIFNKQRQEIPEHTETIVDRLQLLAPKAYVTMLRRLKAAEHNPAGQRHALNHYSYYYDLAERADGMPGSRETLAKLRGKKTEKNELRAFETVVLLRETGHVIDQVLMRSAPKEEIESAALRGVAHSAGLDYVQAQALQENIVSQGIDPIKFGMWIHTSFRSRKLAAYLSPFMLHLANRGSLETWKFDTELGYNLPPEIPADIIKVWRTPHVSQAYKVANQTVTLEYSHDLEPMYLCGDRPTNNCLHYAYGLNQRGLVGLMGSDSKMVTVRNAEQKPIANAIIRLVNDNDRPGMVVEPLYDASKYPNDRAELNRLLVNEVQNVADTMNVDLNVIETSSNQTAAAARLLWDDAGTKKNRVSFYSPKSPFTYTDVYGIGSKIVRASVLSKK